MTTTAQHHQNAPQTTFQFPGSTTVVRHGADTTGSVTSRLPFDQLLASWNDYWHNRGDGWTQLPDLRDIGLVDDGRTTSVTYTLAKGNTYKIVGVCDNDCSDIDFELRDDNGNLIDSDSAKDDIPIVEVTSIRTGSFTLKVFMQSCSNSAGCVYGVDVYRAR